MESQIDSAERGVRVPDHEGPSAVEMEQMREKESLLLSRTRVLHDLEASQNPRYRVLLTKALNDLDSKLSRMEGSRASAAKA